MKSKFDGIVKVKKQELDIAESNLIRAKDSVKKVEQNIDEIVCEILSLQVPKKGGFEQMQLQRHTLLMLRRQKEHLDFELIEAKNRVHGCQRLYEDANLQYEKMMYLKEEEIAKKIKALQKKERMNMDEIALQLYAGRMS